MKNYVQVVVVFGGDNLALWKPSSEAIVVWVKRTASWTQQCLTLGCQHQDTDRDRLGYLRAVRSWTAQIQKVKAEGYS